MSNRALSVKKEFRRPIQLFTSVFSLLLWCSSTFLAFLESCLFG